MQAIADLPALPTLAQLWLRLRAMFARAVDELGPPSSIAAMPILPRGLRRELIGWIALMETILRKLLLAEAVQLSLSARLPAEASAKAEVHRNAARADLKPAPSEPPDPSRPHTWSTRFLLGPPREPDACDHATPAPRAGSSCARDPMLAGRRRCDFSLRLAMRFETLRRVLDDPAPHARRMAALLRRRARSDPGIVERLAIAVAGPYFVDRLDPRLIVEAIAVALGLRPACIDSG
jgi:hypothetical protein